MQRSIAIFFIISLLGLSVGAIHAGVLSRLYDFTPGAVIYSQEVDDEFNQIINAFSGVSSTKYLWVKNSHGTDPVCRFDQLGAGPIAEFKQNGTTKVSINNTGQIVSALSTGTSPFSVTSTTVNTNLNADLLDGLTSSDFLTGASGIFTLSGTAPQIVFTDTTGGDEDFSITVDGDDMLWERVSDGQDLLRLDSDSGTELILASDGNAVFSFDSAGNDINIRADTTPMFTIEKSDGTDLLNIDPSNTIMEIVGANPQFRFLDSDSTDFDISVNGAELQIEYGAGNPTGDLLTLTATAMTLFGPASGADVGIIIDSPTAGDSFLRFNTTQFSANEIEFFQSDTTGIFSINTVAGTNVVSISSVPSFKHSNAYPVGFTPQTITIADSGDANPATQNLTATSSYVRLTCSDADGCTITMIETAAFDGQVLTITNASANACNFADTSGVSELAGAFAMGQYDSLTLIYASDRYVESNRSNN